MIPGVFALVVILAPVAASAGCRRHPIPPWLRLSQYLITDRNAEIALARSAAPDSISRDAAVLVLGQHGYETAVKGKNGFVCVVQRSWTAGIDDPVFWNPKLRAPHLLQSPGRAIVPSHRYQKDRVDIGGTIQSSNVRQHQSRPRQQGIATHRVWRDVLHDVKATILE